MPAQISDENAAPADPGGYLGPGVALHAPLDRIFLRGHLREIEIGAFHRERGRSQRVRFDVLADIDAAPVARAADDVDGVLSYDTLLEAIDASLASERLALLETLAERIAARILRHDRVARVFVRIEKLDLGPHRLGVEIARVRTGAPPATAADDDAPRPRIVLLPPGAQDDPDLPAALDRLAGHPTVLIAAPDFAPPPSRAPAARRRLALLALDQAAWRLGAGDDARAVVLDSRTELDWSLRRGGLLVWAPSRMVLDATDPPEGTAPETLARWLAATLGAAVLVLPPGIATAPGPVPERRAATLSDL